MWTSSVTRWLRSSNVGTRSSSIAPELADITGAGMRVLEGAARHGRITLVHPTPIVHLLASVFGLEVADGDPSEFTDREDLPAALLFTDATDTAPSARTKRAPSSCRNCVTSPRPGGS